VSTAQNNTTYLLHKTIYLLFKANGEQDIRLQHIQSAK